jgi:hypothetical protein
VRVLAGLVLAPQRGVRVQLQDDPVGVGAERPEGLGLRRRGQLLIRLGQELPVQVRGLVLGDAQVHRVDLPGPQRRERDRQPGRDSAGVDDLALGGLPGHVQVRGQCLGRELADLRVAGQARDGRVGIPGIQPAGTAAGTGGRVRGGSGTAGAGAGGVLADRGQLRPGRERPDPADSGDHAGQVIVRQSGQDLLIGGRGVHQGGQDRPGEQLVRGAVLAEPGPGDILRGQFLARGRGRHQLRQVGRAVVLLVPGRREPGRPERLRGLRGAVVPARRSRPRPGAV